MKFIYFISLLVLLNCKVSADQESDKALKVLDSYMLEDSTLEGKNQYIEANRLTILGERYHFGQGVKQDYLKARGLYLEAVKLGSAQAANHLGRLYTNGEGVPKNAEEAQKWYVKSVELDPSLGNQGMNGLHPNRLLCAVVIPAMGGTPSAQYELGRLYEIGAPDLEIDLQKAFTLYRKAAGQHYAPAALALARCYRDGIGVAKDAHKADQWEKKGWALEKQAGYAK